MFSTIQTNLVRAGKGRDPNVAAQFYLRENEWAERLAASRDEFLLELSLLQPPGLHHE